MKNSFKKLIIAGLSLFALFVIGSNLPSFQPRYDVALGATIPIPIANFSTSLTNSITASDTSMTLVSITTEAGTTLTNGAVYGFVIDEGTSIQETVIGTVDTSNNTVTGLTRGVSPITGNTEITALKKAHRRGASVKITDHPVLPVLARILNGVETIPNPLSYASGVGPISSSDLADKEYVLSVVSGGAVTTDKVVISGNAGETIASGELIYKLSSDNEWYKTDADTAATVENVMLGIAQGSGTNGNAISGGILVRGIATNVSGLSANTIYYASNTAGGFSSSAGTKEVTVGIAVSTTSIDFNPRYNQQLTEDEQDALAGGSTFGTPSATNKFITQDYNSSATGLPVITVYHTASTAIGGSTTQFDITNPAGTTFRYTWDSTGTDPTISCTPNPIGTLINFQAQNFTAANNGIFTLTGCGSNYVEVTNASGVAENDKTIGTGYVVESGTTGWTKPSGLKYIEVEVVGGGAGGDGITCGGSCSGESSGGGAGGYSYEIIPAASLSATEYYIVGAGGVTDVVGRASSFQTHLQATGGKTLSAGSSVGGVGSNGNVNVGGGAGGGANGTGSSSVPQGAGAGGSNPLGGGGYPGNSAGQPGGDGQAFGGGGGGCIVNSSSSCSGGTGSSGVVIVREYFN